MKHRTLRAICALIITAAVILSFPSCKSDNHDAEEGAGYVTNSNKFGLFVPLDWTVTLADDALSARDKDGSAVTVAVFDYTTSEYMTIDLAWEKISENFKTFFNGNYSFVELSDEDTLCKIDGITAKRYIYTGTVAGIDMKYEQYLTIYGSRVFQMVFSSSKELFDGHSGEFDDILSKFSFSSSGKTAPEGYKMATAPEKVAYDGDKFTVTIDRDWIVDSTTGYLTARYASGFPSSISFVSADMGEYTSVADYWNSYKETFEKSLKDFTVVTDDKYNGTEVLISGHNAMQFVFTGVPAVDSENNETTYKYCQVLIENGDEVIICTYASSADTESASGYYETHFEVFRDVLDEFVIND